MKQNVISPLGMEYEKQVFGRIFIFALSLMMN